MAPRSRCCLRNRRRARNENLLVMSLIQGLCGLCALILATVSLASAKLLYAARLDKAACLVSGVVMLVTALHGIVTSRRKIYCTVMTLMVLCILSCISNASLLLSCACGLYHFVTGADKSSLALSDLVISILLLMIGLLDLGVAVACAMLCGRQVCRHDRRIALHPGGRGLVILDLPPPPPYTAAGAGPPPLPPLLLPLLAAAPALPPSYSSSRLADSEGDAAMVDLSMGLQGLRWQILPAEESRTLGYCPPGVQ